LIQAELEKILKWYREEMPKKREHLRSLNLGVTEEQLDEMSRRFEWYEVGIRPQKLNKLVEEGILKIVYKSGKHTEYTLAIPIEELEAMVDARDITTLKPERRKISDSELFRRIVGYDDVKTALKMIIETEKPLGCILYGPPASGKSLFLEDIYHYYGDGAEFMTGNEFSAAGLAKLIREREPEVIIIDEIDKAKPQELSALLQPLEGGYVRRVKGDLITDAKRVAIKVFMAGNSIKKVPAEIISRCKPFVLHLPEYNYEQFKQVCLNYLPEEGVSREVAEFIAEEVWKLGSGYRDVRAARNLARVCGDDVEKIKFMLELIKKYRGV
jgi:hypothetical protein